jgi:hypothetical protein
MASGTTDRRRVDRIDSQNIFAQKALWYVFISFTTRSRPGLVLTVRSNHAGSAPRKYIKAAKDFTERSFKYTFLF